MRIVIVGCGYVGTELGVQLAAAGDVVYGIRRHVEGLPEAVLPAEGNVTDRDSLYSALIAAGTPDVVVYTAAAGQRDERTYRDVYVEGLRNTIDVASEMGTPRRVLFTSSTAVYGQADGSWVDESSPTEPAHWNGAIMLEAEQALRDGDVPGTALRLGGIYGPGRNRLIERVRTGEARLAPGPLYTNRIHRDDAVSALRCLIDREVAGDSLDPVYVGVDDEPADEAEVLRWLAERIGAPEPQPAGEGAAPTRGSKRCRNALLRAAGWSPCYPSFREGYAALLEG
ncbi:MAG: SDR family oxidoreductase [Myxococcota bacterium]|nr:SDR family oxidoreductase [Myxococcota bacterium]